MMFKLTESHYWPIRAFTTNYVWYSSDRTLYRRRLDTLVEEHRHDFQGNIQGIYTSNVSDTCIVSLELDYLGTWHLFNDKWVRANGKPAEFDARFEHPLGRYYASRKNHGDHWQLWLKSRNRAVRRSVNHTDATSPSGRRD